MMNGKFHASRDRHGRLILSYDNCSRQPDQLNDTLEAIASILRQHQAWWGIPTPVTVVLIGENDAQNEDDKRRWLIGNGSYIQRQAASGVDKITFRKTTDTLHAVTARKHACCEGAQRDIVRAKVVDFDESIRRPKLEVEALKLTFDEFYPLVRELRSNNLICSHGSDDLEWLMYRLGRQLAARF